MGSGCAFIDFDGDDRLDIYLLNQGGKTGRRNQLFQQQKDGTFRNVSQTSGADLDGINLGVAVGDVNNDGKPDMVVTQYGKICLLQNLGAGKFREISKEANLSNPLWGMSTAFLDYDKDGYLDLVVINYLDYNPARDCFAPDGHQDFCGPNQFPGRSSRLFRNCTGDHSGKIRFKDVSIASGIGNLPGPGLGVVCADLNNDTWPDIFVANDGKPNRLWMNQGNGTFKEEAASRGIAYSGMGQAFAGMGVARGDVVGNGLMDIYVTHLGSEKHNLWKQGPPGQFQDVTAEAKLMSTTNHGTGFGTLMADFDLDGDLDLAVVNGRVFRGGKGTDTGLGFWETYAEKNELMANNGDGSFTDISSSNGPFANYWNVGRGLACGDFDNDGKPDLLVSSLGTAAKLFRNVCTKNNSWVKVRAVDPMLKRDAYGSEVILNVGGKKYHRWINPAESYLSSSSPIAHFGLGSSKTIDNLIVRWPDGREETYTIDGVNQSVTLYRGQGKVR